MLWHTMHNCPINCLFAAELLLGFGTISQSLSRRSDTPLFFQPATAFSPLACVYVLRQKAAVSSHHLDERWSHHQPNPVTAAPPIGKGWGVGYYDNHIALVKGRQFKQKALFLYLFPLSDCSDSGGGKSGSKILMTQL